MVFYLQGVKRLRLPLAAVLLVNEKILHRLVRYGTRYATLREKHSSVRQLLSECANHRYETVNGYARILIKYSPRSNKEGRLFSEGPPLQRFGHLLRNTLSGGRRVDVDTVNSQPTLLLQQRCARRRLHNTHVLRSYVLHRKECLSQINLNYEDAKTLVLAVANSGGGKQLEDKGTPQRLRDFHEEIKTVIYPYIIKGESAVFKLATIHFEEERSKFVATKKKSDTFSKSLVGTVVSYLNNTLENTCLLAADEYGIKSGWWTDSVSFEFDGLKASLVQEVTTAALSQIKTYMLNTTGFKITLKFKAVDDRLHLPKDLHGPPNDEQIVVVDDNQAAEIFFEVTKPTIRKCEDTFFV